MTYTGCINSDSAGHPSSAGVCVAVLPEETPHDRYISTIKYVLLAGLATMTAGQVWLTQISASSRYATAVLPGLLLTSLGIGLALPTASIPITADVRGRDQGLAGALFTTGQQSAPRSGSPSWPPSRRPASPRARS